MPFCDSSLQLGGWNSVFSFFSERCNCLSHAILLVQAVNGDISIWGSIPFDKVFKLLPVRFFRCAGGQTDWKPSTNEVPRASGASVDKPTARISNHK